MAKVTSSKDLLMLLLYAKGHTGRPCEPIRGRTRLMKMVFLFDKEIRRKFNVGTTIASEAFPDFSAYDFGPFSAQVFSDLEFLVDMQLVVPEEMTNSQVVMEEAMEYDYWRAGSGSDPEDAGPVNEEEFSLTAWGREFVEGGNAGTLSTEQWGVLDEFKSRCTRTSLRSLLKYVYTKYPNTTTESKIRDEILATSPY